MVGGTEMKTKKLLMLMAADILVITGLLLSGCTGNNTGTKEPLENEGALIEQSGEAIGSLSDIGTDLSDEPIDDIGVPEGDVAVPDVGMGSFDMDFGIDPSVDIPELSPGVPDLNVDMSSGDVDCSRYANVPDCSYISDPRGRDECERCKGLK